MKGIDIIFFFRVFGLPADFKEGVVFSTYATLVSSVQKGTYQFIIIPLVSHLSKVLCLGFLQFNSPN